MVTHESFLWKWYITGNWRMEARRCSNRAQCFCRKWMLQWKWDRLWPNSNCLPLLFFELSFAQSYFQKRVPDFPTKMRIFSLGRQNHKRMFSFVHLLKAPARYFSLLKNFHLNRAAVMLNVDCSFNCHVQNVSHCNIRYGRRTALMLLQFTCPRAHQKFL